MSGTMSFNGVSAGSMGLRIGSVNVYDAPGREVQTYRVPGRIGDIYPTKDLSQIPNKIREYNAGLYLRSGSKEQTERALTEIRAWLMTEDYGELRDSYEPDFYRRGFFYGDFSPVRKGAGENFEIPLRFSCDPRRFVADAPKIIIDGSSSSTHVLTPQAVKGFPITEAARPLIYISNGGDHIELTFTDYASGKLIGKLIVAAAEQDFWFDAEDLTAYLDDDDRTEANALIEDVIGEIRLGPGPTEIDFNSALCAITFTPRWWVR